VFLNRPDQTLGMVTKIAVIELFDPVSQ